MRAQHDAGSQIRAGEMPKHFVGDRTGCGASRCAEGGGRAACRARAGRLVDTGNGVRAAHSAAVHRSAGSRADQRAPRQRICAQLSPHLRRRFGSRSERDRQTLQGRGVGGGREDRADLSRPGSRAWRARRCGGTAGRAVGGRSLCRVVPPVRRGQAAGRDQHADPSASRLAGGPGGPAECNPGRRVGSRAGCAAGAAGGGAAGSGNFPHFGGSCRAGAAAGCRRTVRPTADCAPGERRRLGAGT